MPANRRRSAFATSRRINFILMPHEGRCGSSAAEYRYTVLFEKLLGGGYRVLVPEIPEIVSHGETLAEARKMAQDAIICVLESMRKHNETIPSDIEPSREEIAVSIA